MKYIDFIKGQWEEYFESAYIARFPFKPKFIQEEDCIANGENALMEDGFDYTTIMTKDKYGVGTKIWLTCSFEKFGAPLVTLTDDLRRDEEGDLIYGTCTEVVLWEEGINVWNLYEENNEVKWDKILGLEFPVESGSKKELYLELQDKGIYVVIDDKRFALRVENLPEEMNIGITGCEDINRFYSVRIETK